MVIFMTFGDRHTIRLLAHVARKEGSNTPDEIGKQQDVERDGQFLTHSFRLTDGDALKETVDF